MRGAMISPRIVGLYLQFFVGQSLVILRLSELSPKPFKGKAMLGAYDECTLDGTRVVSSPRNGEVANTCWIWLVKTSSVYEALGPRLAGVAGGAWARVRC